MRCLGSVLLKCLSQVPDAKVTYSLYTSCFMHGPEATFPNSMQEFHEGHDINTHSEIASKFTDLHDGSKYTYNWVKEQYEGSYPGKKYLICKDAPFALRENYDLIPEGFCHTFLIRHPYRMWSSWKKTYIPYYAEKNLKTAIEDYFTGYFNYKEQYNLLEYLLNKPERSVPSPEVIANGQNQSVKFKPIILDADDLQNHPASILSQFCKATGIPYTDELLHWSSGIDLLKDWKIGREVVGGGLEHGDWGFFKTLLETTEFFPSKTFPEKEDLDDDVLECAELSMPYYEMMHNMRTIRP